MRELRIYFSGIALWLVHFNLFLKYFTIRVSLEFLKEIPSFLGQNLKRNCIFSSTYYEFNAIRARIMYK